ncbi:hypothetical protein O181_070842 [Austropuccinia psidii MF-1]|uniref:CCHC-type domain-containing protein n=1 Tax=Austropuccinia psidii MF-1 TaxID=1389203 RepID=A0A9Q3F422_9BASI|nr:hypothetical protein [Austropuccinia psidii MF-1]
MTPRRIHQLSRGNYNKNQSCHNMEKIDIKIPSKPFIKKENPKEPFETNNTNEQRKCYKCGSIGHLANNFLEKANINEIVETEHHNDKEEESDPEKDTKESETSESD